MITTLALDAWIPMVGVIALVFATGFYYAVTRYVRCPPNRILVIYGKLPGGQTARCIHGGGAMVLPVIQDYMLMSLEPMQFQLETRPLTKTSKHIELMARCSVAISREPQIMQNAAQRLLGLTQVEIARQATEIVSIQIRLTASEFNPDEIIAQPKNFVAAVRDAGTKELNSIGLEFVTIEICAKSAPGSDSDAAAPQNP